MNRKPNFSLLLIFQMVLQLVIVTSSVFVALTANDLATAEVDEYRITKVLRNEDEDTNVRLEKAIKYITATLRVEKELIQSFANLGAFMYLIAIISLVVVLINIYLWWRVTSGAKEPLQKQW